MTAAPSMAQLQYELSEAGKLYSTALQQNDILRSAYNELQATNSSLTARVASLQSSLTSAADAQRALDSDYQQRYNQYTAALQAKDAELTAVLSSHIPPHSLDLIRAQITEELSTPWRERLHTAQSRLADVTRQLAVADKERAVLQLESAATADLLKQLHARERDDLSAKLSDALSRASSLRADLDARAYPARVEALERDNAELLLRLKKIGEELTHTRDEAARAEAEHDRARGDWDRDRATMATRVTMAEKAVELGKVREEETTAELGRLRRELADAVTRRSACEDEVREVREEARRREAEVSTLRALFERKARDREAAEEERDRLHRALTDDLYEQLRTLNADKDDLRKQAVDANDALLRAIKQHALDDEARRRQSHTARADEPVKAKTDAAAAADAGEVAALRAAAAAAQRHVKAVVEDKARVEAKWETLALERERERREEAERQAEYAALQSKHRETRAREAELRDKAGSLGLQVGLLQAERDDLKRERDEERRMFVASRDQQTSAWRHEKLLLLQRLAASPAPSASTSAPSSSHDGGKYKAMCLSLREKLSALIKECERDRGEWERRLQRKELELEDAARKLRESEQFRAELTRQLRIAPPLAALHGAST